MSISLSLPCDRLLLDACCVFALHHSGHMGDILAAAASEAAVASYVMEHELLDIDIRNLVESGQLTILVPDGEAEETLVVNFASRLEDGEAYTGAIAEHRNWAIATDEVKAINFFTRRQPPLRLATTPDLLQNWATLAGVSNSTLRSALESISSHARYRPRQAHHLRSWWDAHS